MFGNIEKIIFTRFIDDMSKTMVLRIFIGEKEPQIL